MPPLPKSFQFSQASLQDFVDCQRRFDLRYRMGLRWPAIETEPVEQQERRMLLGKAFHQLVQQQTVGLPEELVQRASLASDMAPELSDWWRNFLVYRPVQLFGGDHGATRVHSELPLMAFVAGYPVVVRYDALLSVPGGRAVILDWKTSGKRPSEQVLAQRMQTRVYRFLLVEAGGALNGGAPVEPEQVEMVYWFPEFPDAPARFPYDAIQYAKDADDLAVLMARIVAMQDGDFGMTGDENHCRCCTYRSYCDRGVQAGELEDVAAVWELQEQGASLELDFSRIAEIEY